MRQLLILGILCLSYLSHSQINWNEYKESDNTIKNIFVEARSNYSANTTGAKYESLIGTLGARYSSRKVKDLSITNLSIGSQFQYDFEDFNSSTNSFGINLSHSHYFNDRRGLFIEGSLNGSYQLQHDQFFGTDFSDRNQIGLRLGYGRMENISRVYQSIRIDRSLNNNGALNQENIFGMANTLEQIGFNNAFDSGTIDSEKQANFVNELGSQGYDVSSLANISSALNNFTLEVPNVLRQGKSISFGLEENRSFNNKFSSRYASINLDYATAINEKWHFDSSANFRQQIGSIKRRNYSLSTQVSYLPSARTRISFNNYLSYDDLSSFNILNNSTSINASYAVSKNISIFGNIGYNISKLSGSSSFGPSKTQRIFSGIGIRANF